MKSVYFWFSVTRCYHYWHALHSDYYSHLSDIVLSCIHQVCLWEYWKQCEQELSSSKKSEQAMIEWERQSNSKIENNSLNVNSVNKEECYLNFNNAVIEFNWCQRIIAHLLFRAWQWCHWPYLLLLCFWWDWTPLTRHLPMIIKLDCNHFAFTTLDVTKF